MTMTFKRNCTELMCYHCYLILTPSFQFCVQTLNNSSRLWADYFIVGFVDFRVRGKYCSVIFVVLVLPWLLVSQSVSECVLLTAEHINVCIQEAHGPHCLSEQLGITSTCILSSKLFIKFWNYGGESAIMQRAENKVSLSHVI